MTSSICSPSEKSAYVPGQSPEAIRPCHPSGGVQRGEAPLRFFIRGWGGTGLKTSLEIALAIQGQCSN
jgi:hypothetical protein